MLGSAHDLAVCQQLDRFIIKLRVKFKGTSARAAAAGLLPGIRALGSWLLLRSPPALPSGALESRESGSHKRLLSAQPDHHVEPRGPSLKGFRAADWISYRCQAGSRGHCQCPEAA